jgi:hypothetical protein
MRQLSGRGVQALRWAVAVGLALAAWPARAGDPAVEGQWGPLMTWPAPAVHSHLLPTGKVLFFPEFEDGDNPRTWDPASGAITNLPHAGHNIFCSGHTFLPDGRLLVAGGHVASYVGLADSTLYDPFSNTWKRTPPMNAARWYPTATSLPDGTALVISGTIDENTDNLLPQVYDPVSNTYRDLTSAQREMAYYPWMFVLSDGRLFCAGPRGRGLLLDTRGTGSWAYSAFTAGGTRSYGSAVMYGQDKVLIVGGGDPPKATAEIIDLQAATPAWQATAPLSRPRRQHNTTLLPDGTVLVTGGSAGAGFNNKTDPVRNAELWDPATGQWTLLAAEERFRGYHSTALLLPDGRVLSAGGRKDEPTAQVFSPPYLFKGPRPTLASAPAVVDWGASFTVQTPEAASISKVTLVRLSSVTHAINMNQRFNTLAFTRGTGSLSVTAPANANLAPPGHYLLFLLSDQGVPSVAKVLRVGGSEPPPPPPQPSTGFPYGSDWRYHDGAVDLGTAWLAPGYDDTGWKSGVGQFGYGDGDEKTLLTRQSATASQPSLYFRKTLHLDAPVTHAMLKALYDDGLAVWVNGTLVFSRNMANGTAYAAFASASSADNAEATATLNLAPNPFVLGDNVIAVMVKQSAATSADTSFDLSLALTVDSGTQHPTLKLTAPNGGEVFTAGSTVHVQWTTTGSLPTVKLELSTDGGLTWAPLADALANSGMYMWTVPNVSTTRAQLRVSGGMHTADTSDGTFTLQAAPPPPGPLPNIPRGAVWKYHDGAVDLGDAWLSASYDDAAWKSGPAQLGYGDGDERTVLARQSSTASQPSLYFRKVLRLDKPVSAATLKVVFDDGFAVWVNGTLVLSRHVANGTAYGAFASGSSGDNAVVSGTIPLTPSPFVVGDNVIGVIVKQSAASSTDTSFDLELTLQ